MPITIQLLPMPLQLLIDLEQEWLIHIQLMQLTVFKIAIVHVNLFVNHFFNHLAFEIYYRGSIVSLFVKMDGVGLVLDASHFKGTFQDWSILL